MVDSDNNVESILAENVNKLTVEDSAAAPEPPLPPHRSHDPENSQKRSDPFQFGSRYLNGEDDVFEFNAWDHVETDDVYKEYAETQYAKQREAPVSEFDKSESSRSYTSSATLAPDDSKMYSSSEAESP